MQQLPRRRGFLIRLAAGAAALAGGVGTSAAAQLPSRARAPDQDRWLELLTAEFRQVFDLVTPAGHIGLAFARNLLNASAEAYGLTDRDTNIVVSFRHSATPYAFGNAIWERYDLGNVYEIDDPATGQRAARNPVLGAESDASSRMSASMHALAARGVIFTVCGMAYLRLVGEAARRSGSRDLEAVRAEWEKALFPGAFVAPAGVVAVNRAQKHGCAYTYAG